jgi:DNA-binding protein H-NS
VPKPISQKQFINSTLCVIYSFFIGVSVNNSTWENVRGKIVNSEELKSMSVDALLSFRRQIDEVLSQRREELEQQLQQITGKRPYDNSLRTGQKINGRATYQSRKNPELRWSGRGLLPRWMRAEMKGTKLTKEDFRAN